MIGNANSLLKALFCPGRLGVFGLAELRETTGLTSHQLRDAADVLIARHLASRSARGFLRLTGYGRHHAALGTVITTGPRGPNATDPRFTYRARLWRALRMLKTFTAVDVVRLAANGSEKDALPQARKYLDALTRAEILGRHQGPEKDWTYALLVDLGPKAPHWNKRNGQVSDPNHGEVFSA